VPFCFCVQPGHLLGQVTRPDMLFFFFKKKERERDLFSGIFILKFEFFYVVKKYIRISYLEYLVFDATTTNIHIYQNLFSCVLHTVITLTCFERFFYIQKILEVLKNTFSYGFLKHNKKLFSCISGFYNMFVKLQRVLANIPKNIKILFWGNSSIIHR
jgi:hypothetical protein